MLTAFQPTSAVSISNVAKNHEHFMSLAESPEVVAHVEKMKAAVEEFTQISKNRQAAMNSTFIDKNVAFKSNENAYFSTVIDTRLSSKTFTQNADDTSKELEKYGPINNDADVISLISTTEINAIYEQKQLSKFRKFQYVIKNLPMDHPDSRYDVRLNILQPMFYFSQLRNQLSMAFRFGEGSQFTFIPGWNVNARHTIPLEGDHATFEISLSQVDGNADGSYATINIKATKVNVALDSDRVKRTVSDVLANQLEAFFKANFIDRDYIVGKVILDPSEGFPSTHMTPRRFKMKVVPDVNNPAHGTAFLAFFIQTTSTKELEYKDLELPSRFNLIPDEYTSMLIVSNRLLHQNLIPEKAKSKYFSFEGSEISVTKGKSYYTTIAKPLKTYYSPVKSMSCKRREVRRKIGTQKPDLSAVNVCDIYTQEGKEVEINNIQVRNSDGLGLELSMDIDYDVGDCEKDYTYYVLGGTNLEKCEKLKNDVTMHVKTEYGIRVQDEQILIEKPSTKISWKKNPEYREKKYCLFKGVNWSCRDYSHDVHPKIEESGTENESYLKASEWAPVPSFGSINSFSVNRVFFTERNIFKFEKARLISDLVVWGQTKSA
eukprot:Nk52_evm2s321 gene=Nk52_evmTU2s321